jgi:hypothetical protein
MSVNVNTTTNTIVVQNANQTITVVDNENANIVNVTQPLVNVIEVASPGPQGPVGPTGPQGPSVPFSNIGGDIFTTTSSLQVSGSFLVSGSSTFTNIGPAIFSGSVDIVGATTMSSALVSGNVTVLGTASINTLVVNQTVLSTGSNTLGDSANDTQTLYGSVIIPTGSLTVTGSFINILESSSVKIQSNISSSFPVGSFYVNGLGYTPIAFSGSQTAFRSDTNGTYINGLNEGNVYIPAFGLSFLYKGNAQIIATGSDFINIGAQYTDSTAIGGSRSLGTIQNGIFSGSYGKNEYIIGLGKVLNTEEGSLYLTKRDNDGKTISLNLNSGNDGFSIFSTLSQPTSSFLKLVSGSSNLIDFRYDANYIQRSTIIGSGTSTSPLAVLQVKGAGTTAYQLGLNVTDTNDKPLLFVQDNGYVGINRVPFSLDGQAWWNLHVSGTVASNNYVIGNTMYVNANVNPVFGGYPMLFKFTSSAAGYANVDFQIQSEPNLSFIAPEIGQTPIFTVKYDGKVGIGANNTQPQYTLDVSGSGNFNNNLTVTGSVIATSFTGSFSGSAAAPGSNSQMLFNNSGIIGAASSVYYRTNGRLGINTDSPAGRLGISGSSSDILLKLDSDTNSNILYVSGSGNVGIGTNTPAVKFTIQQNNQVYSQIDTINFDMAVGIASNSSLISGLDFKNFNNAGQVRLMARNDQNDYIAINSYGSTASGTLFGVNRTNLHALFGQATSDGTKKLAIGTFNAGDLILGTNNLERARIFANGNLAIGTTTDSGYKLDVSGSVRTMDLVPAANNTYTLGAFGNVWATLWVQNGTLNQLYTGTIRSNNTGGVRIASNNANTWAQWFDGTGNLLLQDGGTFTDNRYRLQVNATGSNSGSLFVGGTTIATGSIARTMLISSSLSASANNDVLVGLDIQPTFNAGSFTGVQSVALRLPSAGRISNAGTAGGYNVYVHNTETTINSPSSTGTLGFQLGYVFAGRFMGTTGNLILQNGGTFTDAGFRLDVSGSTRITNNLTVTGSTILNNGQTTIKGAGATSATTALRVENTNASASLVALDNGNVGIGIIVPSASLHISGASVDTLFRVGSPASSNIIFVSGSGAVGIGTSTLDSTYKLTVNGILRSTDISYTNTISTNGGEIRINQSDFLLRRSATIQWSQTTDSNGTKDLGLRRNNTGSLEIYDGVTATGLLANRRDLLVRNISSSLVYITGSSSDTLLRIDSPASSSILFVSGSGNVGVGTNNPVFKLDVSGSTFTRKLIVGTDNTYTGAITGSDLYVKGTSNGTVFIVRDVNNNTLFSAAGASGTGQFVTPAYNIGLGTSTLSSANKVHILSNGATSATTALLIQNSTPTNLLSVLDNGQVAFTSPTMSLAASQSAFSISPIISASNIVGGQYYGVNITPTFFQTTGSQTETALRVAATFTQSSAVATSGTNIIADFGSTSAGSQLTVTDVTSGSIYMVNDVSGIPIIEATSNWDVNMYDFPNKVFEKTGSQVNIYGTMRVSGSFILPLSQSVAPQTGSAYWSGSLLFIYDGTRYRSSSFA